jgi:oligopeptide/dipeptide ABC transporter ATP-binding protein
MKTDINRATNSEHLLQVKELRTYFYTDDGVVKAVDGVSFDVGRGEVLGLVGESGCGKSVTSFSIMRLVGNPGKILSGEINFNGLSLLDIPEHEMEKVRGNKISMIFQQPHSSLNPVIKIGDLLAEVFEIHQHMNKKEAWENSIELMHLVGIPDVEKKAHSYPHELSGGQAQRVMIAMALALNPKLLIADEPTTALDVTIQAQILDLMRALREERGTAIILITHDLGIIAEMADRVAVMYAGQIVEQAEINALFRQPLHPYTQGLIASIPILGNVTQALETIPGNVPNLIDIPPGCRFAPRCLMKAHHNLTICEREEPDLIGLDNRHEVRCWLYQSKAEHHAPISYQNNL